MYIMVPPQISGTKFVIVRSYVLDIYIYTLNRCVDPYGGFLKWGYPQIIYFKDIFHYKPSSYWVPPFMENPIYLHL